MKALDLDCNMMCAWMTSTEGEDPYPKEVRAYLTGALNRMMWCSETTEDFKYELETRSVRSVLDAKKISMVLATERKRRQREGEEVEVVMEGHDDDVVVKTEPPKKRGRKKKNVEK